MYAVVARSTFRSQNAQNRDTFGSPDIKKVHAAMARSTWPSQNTQNTPRSDHLRNLAWLKVRAVMAPTHMLKSKCIKHHMFASPFWTFRCVWQAQKKLHVARHEKNLVVLLQFELQPPLRYTATTTRMLPQLQLHLQLRYATLITLPCTTINSDSLHYVFTLQVQLHENYC